MSSGQYTDIIYHDDGVAKSYREEQHTGYVQHDDMWEMGMKSKQISREGDPNAEYSALQSMIQTAYDNSQGRWITIGADKSQPEGEQGGTPVQIGPGGDIQKGPASLEGKNLDNLDSNPGSQQGEKKSIFNREKQDPHAHTLEVAQQHSDFGPDYDRNIADALDAYNKAKAAGYDQKTLDSLHEQLAMRLGWKEALDKPQIEPVSQEPQPYDPNKMPPKKEGYRSQEYPLKNGQQVTITDQGMGTFVAKVNGEEVGRADLATLHGSGSDFLSNVRVKPEMRRQGIGSAIYDFIESQTGKPLQPSPHDVTPDGQALRSSRSPADMIKGISMDDWQNVVDSHVGQVSDGQMKSDSAGENAKQTVLDQGGSGDQALDAQNQVLKTTQPAEEEPDTSFDFGENTKAEDEPKPEKPKRKKKWYPKTGIDKQIAGEIGSKDREHVDQVKSLMKDAHESYEAGRQDYNSTLRQFLMESGLAKGHDQTTQQKSLAGTMSALRKGAEAATVIKGFDEIFDYALQRPEFGVLLGHDGSESVGEGDEEANLIENIKRGFIPKKPQKHADFLDHAVATYLDEKEKTEEFLKEQGFESMDEYNKSQEEYFNNLEADPFSWKDTEHYLEFYAFTHYGIQGDFFNDENWELIPCAQMDLFGDDGGSKVQAKQQKKTGGRWVTLHGTHVYIENGKITKGPKHMTGKKPSEVGESGWAARMKKKPNLPKPEPKKAKPKKQVDKTTSDMIKWGDRLKKSKEIQSKKGEKETAGIPAVEPKRTIAGRRDSIKKVNDLAQKFDGSDQARKELEAAIQEMQRSRPPRDTRENFREDENSYKAWENAQKVLEKKKKPEADPALDFTDPRVGLKMLDHAYEQGDKKLVKAISDRLDELKKGDKKKPGTAGGKDQKTEADQTEPPRTAKERVEMAKKQGITTFSGRSEFINALQEGKSLEEATKLGKTKEKEVREKRAKKEDDGPKDGDRNEDGLVFRNGRWRREDGDKLNPDGPLGMKRDEWENLSSSEKFKKIRDHAASEEDKKLDFGNDLGKAAKMIRDHEGDYKTQRKIIDKISKIADKAGLDSRQISQLAPESVAKQLEKAIGKQQEKSADPVDQAKKEIRATVGAHRDKMDEVRQWITSAKSAKENEREAELGRVQKTLDELEEMGIPSRANDRDKAKREGLIKEAKEMLQSQQEKTDDITDKGGNPKKDDGPKEGDKKDGLEFRNGRWRRPLSEPDTLDDVAERSRERGDIETRKELKRTLEELHKAKRNEREKIATDAKELAQKDIPEEKKQKALDDLVESANNPRDASTAHHYYDTNSDEYQWARKSEVGPRGEDLLGSARHNRNAFRDFSDIEKAGETGKMVKRDKLIKMKEDHPRDFIENQDDPKQVMGALGLHMVMKKFPASPATQKWKLDAWQRHHKKNPDSPIGKMSEPELLREAAKQYFDEYNKFHDKAMEIAADSELTPEKKVDALADYAYQRHREIAYQGSGYKQAESGKRTAMTQEQFTKSDYNNPLKDQMYSLYKQTKRGANAVHKQLRKFNAKLAEHDGDRYEKAMAIMDGKTLDKAFDQKSGRGSGGGDGKKWFDYTQAYLGHIKRKGGTKTYKDSDWEKADKAMRKEMGIRGLQPGNSMTDKEQAHHYARAAEAFHDLAEATGIPLKAISINGKLGMAFGARGRGGALAHYEPNEHIINLTRKNGAGSLAHEWGHFMDHMLAGGGSELTTKKGKLVSVGQFASGGAGDAHPDIKKAMADLSATMASTGYGERVRKQAEKDKPVTKDDYWEEPHEMFARSFEKYVQYKLGKDGRENTYLSGQDDHPYWPNKKEMEKMAPHFDAIMEHFKDNSTKYEAIFDAKFNTENQGAPQPGVDIDQMINKEKARIRQERRLNQPA